MNRNYRESRPSDSATGMRALTERRVDSGTMRRENVDRPSVVSPAPPHVPMSQRGAVPTQSGRMPVKR